jgi:isoamyl acetate esterase
MNRSTTYFAAGFITAVTLFTLKQLLFPSEKSVSMHANRKKKAVFFGDSITQHGLNPEIDGWLCSFANWWTRRVDVVNRGFSGYNSRWAVLIVDEVVVQERPDIVFVFFGANDAVDKSVGQHVDLPEYEQNMHKVVTVLKQVSLIYV